VLPQKEIIGDDTVEVGKIEFDSRLIGEGDLFVALVGANLDGHDYISDVASRKAACVVVERDIQADIPAKVVVPDTRHALALLAAKYFDYPSHHMKLLGVTGTNGKTTVAYLVQSILNQRGRKAGLIGTVEYLVGDKRFDAPNTTPESLQLEKLLSLMRAERTRFAVMEVSSHALHAGRIRMIEFAAVGITNLTQDHLDFHGSMDEYKKTKALLFDKVHGKDKWAILNMDDGEFDFFRKHVDSSYLTYSVNGKKADIRAADIDVSVSGSRFKMMTPLGSETIQLRLSGEHNISNALCAAAFAMAVGQSPTAIRKGLEAVATVPGRLEAVENDRGITIFVDYAHTPDALDNVCSVCRKLTDKNLVVLFGCGGDRDKTKRVPMAQAVCRFADKIVVTSDNPRGEDPQAIIDDMKPGLDSSIPAEENTDRREAIGAAIEMCSEGDVLLVAGKGHESYMNIGGRKIRFDDREVIKEVLDGLR